MYCAFCGGQNPDDAVYCATCARPLHGVRAQQDSEPRASLDETQVIDAVPSGAPASPGMQPTQSIPAQPSGAPYAQVPTSAGAPDATGAPYTCAVCGFVLGPFDQACARCKTPRGMRVDPNATLPGTYAPLGGYAGSWSGTVPVDRNGWSPANIGPILSNPVAFFIRQRGQTDFVQPSLFFLITSSFNWVLMMIASMMSPQASELGRAGMPMGIMLALTPLIMPFALGMEFLVAGIAHLFCMMFGARGGYAGTFRAVVYAAAPNVIMQIPASLMRMISPEAAALSGLIGMVGAIWTLVLMVIAYREIHQISTGAAIGAVVIPLVLVCGLFMVLMFAIFAAVFSAVGSGHGFGLIQIAYIAKP